MIELKLQEEETPEESKEETAPEVPETPEEEEEEGGKEEEVQVLTETLSWNRIKDRSGKLKWPTNKQIQLVNSRGGRQLTS